MKLKYIFMRFFKNEYLVYSVKYFVIHVGLLLLSLMTAKINFREKIIELFVAKLIEVPNH